MPSSASTWRTNCRSRYPAPLACGRWYVVNWSSLRPRPCCLPRRSLRSRGSLLKQYKANGFNSDPAKLVCSRHHITYLALTGSPGKGCCWPRIRAGRPVRATMRTKAYIFMQFGRSPHLSASPGPYQPPAASGLSSQPMSRLCDREPTSLVGSASPRFPVSRMICSTVASAVVSAVMIRSGTPGRWSRSAINCSSQPPGL